MRACVTVRALTDRRSATDDALSSAALPYDAKIGVAGGYDNRSALLTADLQRKEETIQTLKARVAELTRKQAEEANTKAQLDIFETQFRMREEELTQKNSTSI